MAAKKGNGQKQKKEALKAKKRAQKAARMKHDPRKWEAKKAARQTKNQ